MRTLLPVQFRNFPRFHQIRFPDNDLQPSPSSHHTMRCQRTKIGLLTGRGCLTTGATQPTLLQEAR